LSSPGFFISGESLYYCFNLIVYLYVLKISISFKFNFGRSYVSSNSCILLDFPTYWDMIFQNIP
jgi:hypothetical protein